MNAVAPHPPLAAFLAAHPDVAARVLASHRPHRRGWCLGCGDVRYTDWPCVIRVSAEHALGQLGLVPRQRDGEDG